MKKLLALLCALQLHAVIVLDATTKKIEVTSSAAVSVDFYATWTDTTSSAFTPGQTDGNFATATTTDVVAAPGASTQRRIYYISFVNRGTAAQVLTVKFDVSATERNLTAPITLAAGEALIYEDATGWTTRDVAGRVKMVPSETAGIGGRNYSFYKVGATSEVAGVFYGWWKDTGFPGAWAPGTPGLAGRTTDGTTTTDAGCLPVQNPASGSNYVSMFNVASTVVHQIQMWDVLWVNSGIAVTTTTGQTINSVTWPARDINGSTNGVGVQAAIIVTTATTNGADVTNTTLTYTNDQGTGSRTATLAIFRATAVAGFVGIFQLAAGDTGIRSIQTLTLGTSYGAGAVSLIAFVPIVGAPAMLANVGGITGLSYMNPGIRIYNGTCLLPFGLVSATTATSITGTLVVQER